MLTCVVLNMCVDIVPVLMTALTPFLCERDPVQQDCPMSKIRVRHDVLKVIRLVSKILIFEKERLRISIKC